MSKETEIVFVNAKNKPDEPKPQIEIKHVFVWRDDSRGPWLVIDGKERGFDGVDIHLGPIWYDADRPKWWEFRRRYRLLREIETLPPTRIAIRERSEPASAAAGIP